MTRGADPYFAPDPYAQWIRRELEKRGWGKQDLAAQLVELAPDRLRKAGADGVVRRATYGMELKEMNRALIEAVLGPYPGRLAERFEILVAQAERVLEELPALLDQAKRLRDEV